ncbi:major facilitator superfamily transporter [Fusarium sp. NRRL 25303]|nr:major facilitator superfamily transporter [Fusarium sp. NRRL 25303]
MSSAGQKQQTYQGLTSDEEVSSIWRDEEILTQMDSNVPEAISPLDLSKQNPPKTPRLGIPIARTAYDLQSQESETHATYRNDDCRRDRLPKRVLDAHSNHISSKWQKLMVPTSEFGRVGSSFQQGLMPDFIRQHGNRSPYLISNDCNQDGNDGGPGHGDNIPSSSLDYENHVSEEPPNKLAPSLLPRNKENEPHVVVARFQPSYVMIQNHGSFTSLSSSKYSDFSLNWPSPYPPACPKHRLLSAFACLCLVNFISAIDGTVLVGSLSVRTFPIRVAMIISKDLQASTTESFWIGTSFLLASAIFQPLWTALADILGAIPLMLSALAFFTLGSSLAPMASSTPLLLAARTIQGVGGGGIVALTYIITASLVSLQERGKWFGLISLQWAIGSTVGPLMGGAIAENSDWRWIFWLNLPFCVVGFVFIPIVLLNFSGPSSYSWDKLRHLDWLGAVVLLCSITSCLIPLTLVRDEFLIVYLAGVSFAWLSMEILLPLGAGIVALVFFTIYTIRYSKNQFLRLSLLSSSGAAAAYLGAFVHGMLTYSLLYYLPLYFQVARDYSATISGIALLPWTITVGSAALIIGLLISRKGKYSYFIWFGWVATTAGISLLLSLQNDTPLSVWIMSSVIGGLGLGVTWSATSFASQAAASDDDKPLAGAMFSFVRSIGQAVGVAVSGAIFQNVFRHSIETQKKYAQHASAWTKDSVRVFAALSNSSGPIARDMKDAVVTAHMDALWAIWLVMTILAAVAGLVNMIWLRDPRRRPVIRHIPNETLTQDKESAPI